MTAGERKLQTDDAYRAIGLYLVTFSHFSRIMRQIVERRLAPSVEEDPALPQIALSGAHAMEIAKSLFGMCRRVADFDESEKRVEKVLRAATVKAIEERNDIAHGDWFVGYGAWNAEEIDDPIVQRIHALRADGHEETITYSVKKLDRLTDELKDLTTKTSEFAELALDLPVLLVPQGVSREIRVRDVWTPHGSKKATIIERDGPRAAEVGLIVY
jgi:hypothetical protein